MMIDLDKMQYNYKNTFCFKAPVTNGEFDDLHKRMYELILEDVRVDNAFLKQNGLGDLRYVVRKRYRGPRAKYGRKGSLGESMCLKAHGTSAAVYVYLERPNGSKYFPAI